MELWVIRHAIAEEATGDRPDADRRLTPEGVEKFHQVVEALDGLDWSFDVLLHSPWRRAAETAVLLEARARRRRVEDGLARAPDDGLLDRLARLEAERVGLVGHEPWVSGLVSWLCTGSPKHAGAFAFKKGGVAYLEGEPSPGGMVLRAFVPPRVMRSVR